MVAIQTNVMAAFFEVGFLKAGIPFEIASTPESATAPELKARANKKIVIPPRPRSGVPVSSCNSFSAGKSGGNCASVPCDIL